MLKYTFAALSCTLAIAAAPTYATTVGQPLFIAEVNTTGGILDFFDGIGPSGIKEVDATGTITQEFGASGFVGGEIDYSMNINGIGTLRVGALDLNVVTFTDGFAGGFGDPFADTGLITTTFLVEFDVLATGSDPVSGADLFTIDPFGTGVEIVVEDAPFAEIGVNIFYDGTLPTKFFDDGFGGFDYIEGSFSPTRIEVGLVGGPPVSAVPLPATLPLALFALGALGLVRRRISKH